MALFQQYQQWLATHQYINDLYKIINIPADNLNDEQQIMVDKLSQFMMSVNNNNFEQLAQSFADDLEAQNLIDSKQAMDIKALKYSAVNDPQVPNIQVITTTDVTKKAVDMSKKISTVLSNNRTLA